MINGSFGDMAQSFAMRQRNIGIQADISRLTAELASGQVADISSVMQGNYSYLTDIERKMTTLEGYKVATSEATLFSGAMQATLETVNGLGQDLSSSLITAGSNSGGIAGAAIVAEAQTTLDAMIGRLNTTTGGRYMFSGVATDRPPMPDSATLMTQLRTAVAGATTPDAILTAAQNWFDDPAGFTAQVYQGSNQGLAPFALSHSDDVSLDIKATDPELRDMLRLTAVIALAEDPALGLDAAGRSELFSSASDQLLSAQSGVINLQTRVGFVESRVDTITARNAAETTSLSFARNALLEVDPYTAATQLEEAQFQLQSLYSVTVRNAQLSLVNFL